MDGDDERHPPGKSGQDSGEVRVPGMAMNQVSLAGLGNERQVPAEGGQHWTELSRRVGQLVRWREAPNPKPTTLDVLVAKRPDLDLDQPRKLPGQMLDVHAGAAVDVGRVLIGED